MGNRLTVPADLWSRNLLTAMKPWLTLPTRTRPLLELRGSLRMSSAHLMLTWMRCAMRPRSEEKAARALIDAARLADELRSEQDMAMSLERDRKLMEAQCKDAQTRADEAEVNALKGGKKAMMKMETRIRELESEIDAENRRLGDGSKNLRKAERKVKELTFAADEDKKNHERMQALVDQLQGKVKSYKKQIEEAEETAALNLAKYRKVAGALGDAEAAADQNEQALARMKARADLLPLDPCKFCQELTYEYLFNHN